MIQCVSQALNDRKFWRVRYSGIELLHSLVSRTGHIVGSTISKSEQTVSTTESRKEVLEAMLPHKEKMLALAKKSLSDPEARVTALGSNIIKALSWWP